MRCRRPAVRRPATRVRSDPLARHALPHPYLRGAARERRRRDREARRVGSPPARLREADLHRPPRSPRDHAGRDRRCGRAGGPRDGEPAAERVRRRLRGRGREAPAGHREREARDGRGRAPGPCRDDPQRVEDAAVLRQRPGRAHRREPAAQVPLPRHPTRGDAAPAHAAQPARPGDTRGPPRRTASSRSRRRTSSRARPRAPATSSSRAGSSRARSTRCRRARSSSSSC